MNNRRCSSLGLNFAAFGKFSTLYRLFNYFQRRVVIAALGGVGWLLCLKEYIYFFILLH